MGRLVNGSAGSRTRIDRLVDWASSHGAVLHPSVEVYDDAGTGLSFRVHAAASKPVQPYEPIVDLPTSLTLSYLDALSDQSASRLGGQVLSGLAPHVVGRLFLVKEHLRGEDSFWWPYLQALPQPADTQSWALPPFWSAEEAELLEGTNLEVGMKKINTDVQREFRAAMEQLSTAGDGGVVGNGSNGGDGGDGNGNGGDGGDGNGNGNGCPLTASSLTPALYHWAYCIFSSRSFRPSLVLPASRRDGLPDGVSMDDFSVLLPLFDIGNHDMTTDIRWHLDDARSSCRLEVGKAHQAGEQIFNNYSMKTNAELLLGYGFLVPATDKLHNDYIHVRKRTTSAPVASDEYLISRRPFSHPSSLVARAKRTLAVEPPTDVMGALQHVQPDMVWDIFRTLAQARRLVLDHGKPGSDAERHQRQALLSGRVADEARPVLEQTAAVIQHKVLQELERLDETDVEIVGGDVDLLTANQRLALDYRDRCRKVLESTLEAIGRDEMLGAMMEEP
ncbi:hypothetical protein RJ55_02399 [Drechmeria coniospora]|nr:hypothetical protein RJ55_02399 [Drechmeria coniospora]